VIGQLARNFPSSPFLQLLANILFPTRCVGILKDHRPAKFHTPNYSSPIVAAVKLRTFSHDSQAVILQFKDITLQNYIFHIDQWLFQDSKATVAIFYPKFAQPLCCLTMIIGNEEYGVELYSSDIAFIQGTNFLETLE
jgi:hypothetical protein